MKVSYFLIIWGNIELNPGPKSCDNFSLCHWNLNSIAVHDFSKLSYLQPVTLTYLSKTYLGSSIPQDDPRLNLSGYNLVRGDSLSNNERGGVGIYFKETLAIRPVPTNSLKECLLLEVFIGNKKGFVLSLYRSPSQSQEEFYDFLFSPDQLPSNMISHNPVFLLVTGDFNARNSPWWKNDCVTREGNEIESLTCSYGLSQLFSDPTHILQNSSSCIDLIFTNQPKVRN